MSSFSPLWGGNHSIVVSRNFGLLLVQYPAARAAGWARSSRTAARRRGLDQRRDTAQDLAPEPPRGERDLIVGALHKADGNWMRAAESLGIARSSLYRKLKTFGITVTDS